MRVRAVSLLLIVCLAIASLGVAGCGSSKKHHTARNAAIAAGVALAIHHHHKKVQEKKAAAAAAAGNYHAGEFCSKKKASTYSAAGLKCVKVHGTYRLEKA
jgi:hypothetical protein